MPENGAMLKPLARSRLRDTLWRELPVALIALLGIGYLIETLATTAGRNAAAHDWLPPAIVLGQGALLLARHRYRGSVLVAVAALDWASQLTSSGELSTTGIAVGVAAYSYARGRRTRPGMLLLLGIAAASIVVTTLSLQGSADISGGWLLPFAVLRVVLTLGIAIAIAVVADGRARLVDALRERAAAAEREKERRAEEAVRRERTLMARELHDIAAHHLSGIIVGAQAADALRLRDPERAGEYIRQVQSDARTTLHNLRQTVGLLRADSTGELAPVPSLEQLPTLVAEASTAGTPVELVESGEPRALGPLAGIAVYRMVQESLANALRHAPGASRTVEVEYLASAVRVSARNGPAPVRDASIDAPHEGYGLIGMAERAELIGAELRTGPTTDGGWANTLQIPYDEEQS
jgi:signal transduction histidine kinase